MRCIVFGTPQALHWQLTLENSSEAFSVTIAPDLGAACALLDAAPPEVLILGASSESRALYAQVIARPPLPPPYLVLDGWTDSCADICPAAASPLQAALQPHLPRLCLAAMEHTACLARALLHALGVRDSLRAMCFLPDMLALCTLHPVLLHDLNTQLYPLIARRHGMTAAAVERSLRLLIESTWNRVPLDALERFFGHSVDPERGKPTNREFLAQMQQRLLLAARRSFSQPYAAAHIRVLP